MLLYVRLQVSQVLICILDLIAKYCQCRWGVLLAKKKIHSSRSHGSLLSFVD